MSPLTKEDINQVSKAVVDGLQKHLLTKQDLEDGLEGLHIDVHQNFSDLQSSVDHYLTKT